MLLLIGWRGELVGDAQLKDEPQHVKQGRITLELLDCLDIPYEILGADTKEVDQLATSLIARMRNELRPVALVVRKDTFTSLKEDLPQPAYKLAREDALKAITELLPDDVIVVATTGKTSRELYEIRTAQGRSSESDFLTVGSMGHALQIASGLALARPGRKVMCIDGDGALIMHMGGITTAAAIPNLSHVVINNGAHDSVGGQPTRGFEIDMPALARACGYGTACRVTEAGEIGRAICEAVSAHGSTFIEIRTRLGSRANLGRPEKIAGRG